MLADARAFNAQARLCRMPRYAASGVILKALGSAKFILSEQVSTPGTQD